MAKSTKNAHSEFWDSVASKQGSQKKKINKSSDDKPRNIYEAIAPQRRSDGTSSGDGGQTKPGTRGPLATARNPENMKTFEAIAPQKPLTVEEMNVYNKKKKLRSK